jgi:hypothetical protein
VVTLGDFERLILQALAGPQHDLHTLNVIGLQSQTLNEGYMMPTLDRQKSSQPAAMPVEKIHPVVIADTDGDWGHISARRVCVGQTFNVGLDIGVIVAAADVEPGLFEQGRGRDIEEDAILTADAVNALICKGAK